MLRLNALAVLHQSLTMLKSCFVYNTPHFTHIGLEGVSEADSMEERIIVGGDIAPSQRPRMELCVENHSGTDIDYSCAAKSHIHYDRPHNTVDFALTVVPDPAHIPHIKAAGGAAWLPYCLSISLTCLGMEGRAMKVELVGNVLMTGSNANRE